MITSAVLQLINVATYIILEVAAVWHVALKQSLALTITAIEACDSYRGMLRKYYYERSGVLQPKKINNLSATFFKEWFQWRLHSTNNFSRIRSTFSFLVIASCKEYLEIELHNNALRKFHISSPWTLTALHSDDSRLTKVSSGKPPSLAIQSRLSWVAQEFVTQRDCWMHLSDRPKT